MFGLFVGAIIGLALAECDVVDHWWILWSALIGLLIEIAARLGCPELVDAVAEILSLIACVSGD